MSEARGRWDLLRDVFVVQVKLLADGLRDIALSPVLFVTGMIAVIVGKPSTQALFYDSVRFGRRTEQWLDIFSVGGDVPRDEGPAFDDLIARVEDLLVEQHRRGGVTASARQAIDQALDALQRQRRS
jgi:hypothetical protein